MPRYREVYIEQAKALADSGSETIEIATADPISELLVKFYATNGATSNKAAPIPLVVTKIEVFDGSDKLYSCDGEVAAALVRYHNDAQPHLTINEAGNYIQSSHFAIRFGRWLWDPVFALVPQAFRNLQLKVSWNLAEVRAVGATGYATGTGRLTVIAKVMEGLEAPPSGFLMQKEHYTFTSAASGDERISLPTDHPYVSLLVRAYEAGVDMTASLTNFKLSLDHDKAIPFDHLEGDFRGQMENMFGEYELPIFCLSDDAEAHESWLGVPSAATVTPQTASRIVAVTALSGGRYTMSQVTDAGVAANALNSFVKIFGQCLFNCWYYRFGTLDDPSTWLMAPSIGDIKLMLTQGNAGAAVSVVLTQARSYAAAAA